MSSGAQISVAQVLSLKHLYFRPKRDKWLFPVAWEFRNNVRHVVARIAANWSGPSLCTLTGSWFLNSCLIDSWIWRSIWFWVLGRTCYHPHGDNFAAFRSRHIADAKEKPLNTFFGEISFTYCLLYLLIVSFTATCSSCRVSVFFQRSCSLRLEGLFISTGACFRSRGPLLRVLQHPEFLHSFHVIP